MELELIRNEKPITGEQQEEYRKWRALRYRDYILYYYLLIQSYGSGRLWIDFAPLHNLLIKIAAHDKVAIGWLNSGLVHRCCCYRKDKIMIQTCVVYTDEDEKCYRRVITIEKGCFKMNFFFNSF